VTTNRTHRKILAMARRGVRQVDIAADLNVSQGLVSRVLKREGINSQIRNLRTKALRAASDYTRALRMNGDEEQAAPWDAAVTYTTALAAVTRGEG
jgi:predicted transcriptional regulator